MPKRIVAVVGSYRKTGIIHQTVYALLTEAKTKGADVEKIDLIDRRITFCKNCRTCTQKEPDRPRGRCVHRDDMSRILDKLESA
ncbi:MAG TPA: NAD(P)H-dependent oxidoreductase, partial [bacterium]